MWQLNWKQMAMTTNNVKQAAAKQYGHITSSSQSNMARYRGSHNKDNSRNNVSHAGPTTNDINKMGRHQQRNTKTCNRRSNQGLRREVLPPNEPNRRGIGALDPVITTTIAARGVYGSDQTLGCGSYVLSRSRHTTTYT